MLKLDTNGGNKGVVLSNGVAVDSSLVLLQRKEDADQFVADAYAGALQKEANQVGSNIANYGGAVSQVLTVTQSSAVVALLLHYGLPQVASAVQNQLFSDVTNVLSTSVSVTLSGVFAAGFVINAFRNRAIRQGIENAQGEVQENIAIARSTFARISNAVSASAKYVYDNYIKVAKQK